MIKIKKKQNRTENELKNNLLKSSIFRIDLISGYGASEKYISRYDIHVGAEIFSSFPIHPSGICIHHSLVERRPSFCLN